MHQILLFSKNGCMNCKLMKQIVSEVPNIQQCITEINLDDSWDSLDAPYEEKYNLTTVPTMVYLNDQGKEIGRLTGLRPLTGINRWLEETNDYGQN